MNLVIYQHNHSKWLLTLTQSESFSRPDELLFGFLGIISFVLVQQATSNRNTDPFLIILDGTIKQSLLMKMYILQWRHNGRNDISNYQPHHCLLNHLFRCRSMKISKLCITGFWMGIHQWLVNSQHKWPVSRKMVPFDDIIIKWY